MSSSLSLVFRTFLGIVDFHSVRIATSLSSGPAVSSVASSSANLISVSFLYRSFVKCVINLDRSYLKAIQRCRVSSIAHELVLNIILQSAIVYSAERSVVPSSARGVFLKFCGVLGCGCLLSNMLDLSNCDLLVVAQSVDTLNSTDELVPVVKASVLVDVPN